jgi:hypothetical protein
MLTKKMLLGAIYFAIVRFALTCSGQVIQYGNCAIDFEVVELPECALTTIKGRLYIPKGFADDVFSGKLDGVVANPINVSGKRLASTMIPHGGWAYFDRTGLVVVQNVSTFDNGADAFHHGLVSVRKGDKWGLADSTGRFVVPIRYDGLRYDEANFTWLACSGCRIEIGGEHSWFTGGNWVRINASGRVIGSVPDPSGTAKKK